MRHSINLYKGYKNHSTNRNFDVSESFLILCFCFCLFRGGGSSNNKTCFRYFWKKKFVSEKFSSFIVSKSFFFFSQVGLVSATFRVKWLRQQKRQFSCININYNLSLGIRWNLGGKRKKLDYKSWCDKDLKCWKIVAYVELCFTLNLQIAIIDELKSFFEDIEIKNIVACDKPLKIESNLKWISSCLKFMSFLGPSIKKCNRWCSSAFFALCHQLEKAVDI